MEYRLEMGIYWLDITETTFNWKSCFGNKIRIKQVGGTRLLAGYDSSLYVVGLFQNTAFAANTAPDGVHDLRQL